MKNKDDICIRGRRLRLNALVFGSIVDPAGKRSFKYCTRNKKNTLG